ncbi:transposon Tf2-9 polyprotein [Trichonephila clavipes]|uniref:Transposon Tf2-9 polyprotein n=1 Tax=Trichonephila clavipes TaxID=2585209 RepID=A0A8X6RX50_TRICX|nr:transposon Tf2-9 polyprotein [Trichonephila clavipes]
MNDVVTVTSVDTGTVIDTEILSKHCICIDKKKHGPVCKNFDGYSGQMEINLEALFSNTYSSLQSSKDRATTTLICCCIYTTFSDFLPTPLRQRLGHGYRKGYKYGISDHLSPLIKGIYSEIIHSLTLKLNTFLKTNLANSLLTNERHYATNETKENILRLHDNKKQYNKHRKPAYNHKPGDTVAIQRTQFATDMKLRPKYFGPYEVTKVNKHDHYEVQKIGQHEGPNVTSTSTDKMKKWCTH